MGSAPAGEPGDTREDKAAGISKSLLMSTTMSCRSFLIPRIRARLADQRAREIASLPYPPDLARKMIVAARERIESRPVALGDLFDELVLYVEERERVGEDPDRVVHELLARGREWAMR